MKGVLRARARPDATCREGGPQRCGPLLFVVICLCLLQIPSVICDNIKLHVLQGTHVCV